MKSLNNSSIAVAYVRVSTEEQHLGQEAQRKQIETWAQRENATIGVWRIDHGISGAAGLDKRPGLASALNDLKACQARWLVVAKRDRLARDVLLAGAIEAIARRSGATIATADGSPVGDEPGEVMQRQMMDVFAQYERAVIGVRTKAALAVKKTKGERIGNIPYGYRLAKDGKHIEKHIGEQAIIARALQLRAKGGTLRSIAATLSREFRTRAGTGFIHPQVRRMLRALASLPAPGATDPRDG